MLRKLLLVIAMIFVAALCWSFSRSQAGQDYTYNPQGAPYCNRAPNTFIPPLPADCPEDVDTACLMACRDTYRAQMGVAHDTACAAAGEAWSSYDDSVDAVMEELNDCLATATDPALAAACEQFAEVGFETALNNLNTTLQSIDDDLESEKSRLDSEYVSCTATCCRWWPYPPPPIGG